TVPTISSVSAAPTPFSPNGDTVKDNTTIAYTLSEAAMVTVKVYNASNILVRTLISAASRSAGANSEVWNGENDASSIVADGTYTYKIDATDAAGNAATQQSGTVVVSAMAPSVTVTSSANPSVVGQSVTFTATVTGTGGTPTGTVTFQDGGT